jgi:hypothetical protein
MQGKAFCTEMQFVQGMAFLPDDEIFGEKLIPIKFTVADTKPGHPDDIKKLGEGGKE